VLYSFLVLIGQIFVLEQDGDRSENSVFGDLDEIGAIHERQ
jgi:hypothetical protein